jgi:hypothetical protein
MYEIAYDRQFVPRPSPKVNVSTRTYDAQERYFMKNHALGTLYELDKSSYNIWNLIDGKRSMENILEQMEKSYPDVNPTTTFQTILFFAESGALREKLEQTKKKRVNFTSALRINITLVERSENFLKAIHKALKPLLRRELLWVSLAFVLVAGIAFAGQFMHILGDRSRFELFGSTIVGLFIYNFIILAPVTAIHEIAHGLTVVHYGGKPKDMGTGWFYFGPMFYCDATDAWTFSRGKRMMVMLAGNLSTMLIGSAIVVAVFVWPFSPVVSSVLSMTAFWCFYTSLWNFAPPFETDGYYVLADLLKMSNLRHDAYDYLKTSVKKTLRMPVQESEGFTTRKKRIFLVYALMSVAWLVYMAYQSFTFMTYMAKDANVAALRISSVIMLPKASSTAVFFLSLASIAYFTMMVSGYGLLFFNAGKKAITRTLKFESIHDRDLSIFLYLPSRVPDKIEVALRQQTAKIARKFTQNFHIKHEGPLTIAVLRMGGGSMALLQIKEYLQKVENAFTSMYEKFLQQHRNEILVSSEIHDPMGIGLSDLLKRMSRESVKAGEADARSITSQIIAEQEKTAIYLLNSAVGKVWTIEMPPALQYDAQRSLFPMFCVEDFSLTDLYDRVEDFKKQTIYGYDSLEKLAVQTQACLSQTLERQDKYQAVAFMQPVRGRLLFIGRTRQIEGVIDKLGSLFVDQVWSGHMDNLLSNTNHMLSALSRTMLPPTEEIVQMSDGELNTLESGLSCLNGNMHLINRTLTDCEERLQTANKNSDEIRRILEPQADFKVGLIEPTLALNEENMRNLPKRFRDFNSHFEKLHSKVLELEGIIKEERKKREPSFKKKRAETLRQYPIILVLSAVLLLTGLEFTTGTMAYSLIGLSAVLQVCFWMIYGLRRESSRMVGKYASPTFDQLHTFVIGLVHAMYQLSSTSDVLSPTRIYFRGGKSEKMNNSAQQ